MRRVFFIELLLFSLPSFSQEVTLNKINEKQCGDTTITVYNLKVFNSTGTPICVPISIYYPSTSEKDTLNLPLMPYPSFKGRLYYSLEYAEIDTKQDAERISTFPFIINPQTYLSTYIRVKRGGNKETFFDFKYSDNDGIDYFKLLRQYATDRTFIWEKTMAFIEKSFLLH